MDEALLEILACPRCDTRPPLKLDGEELICTECGYRYRIVKGIPHLLIEEAIPPKSKEPS